VLECESMSKGTIYGNNVKTASGFAKRVVNTACAQTVCGLAQMPWCRNSVTKK
jgi:hypothetical protein